MPSITLRSRSRSTCSEEDERKRRSRTRDSSNRRRRRHFSRSRSRSRSTSRSGRRTRSFSPSVPRHCSPSHSRSRSRSASTSSKRCRRSKDKKKKDKKKSKKKTHRVHDERPPSHHEEPTSADSNSHSEQEPETRMDIHQSNSEVEPSSGVQNNQKSVNDLQSFFANLHKQEAAKDPVGTLHAQGFKVQSATALTAVEEWECTKAGCGKKNPKNATACGKCGAMRRMSQWR